MTIQMADFVQVMPELFLLSMACLILLVDVFVSEKGRIWSYLLTQGSLLIAALIGLNLYGEPRVTVFNGAVVSDSLGTVLKILIALSTFVVFSYSKRYLRDRNLFSGEFFILGLFGVVGMMILVSAHNLITVYLGLELLSLALYAMVAIQRDSVVSSEAAMKYFILGAMASAMLLYGMSMLYGVTGSLDLGEISAAIGRGEGSGVVLVFGLVFIIVGVAFKLGAVPFHMWVPDVYHGSPTAVTLFISTAPKLAAFGMMMRLLVDGLGGLHGQWQDILVLLSVVSLIVGNVVAIAQTNIKRMLAYSAISHASFLLMGVLTGTQAGYSAALFYAATYVLMGLAGFGMVILMSRAGFEAENLEDYRGLNEKSPWLAAMVLITMFSMAGVPPFLGFWAKLAIIEALVNVGMVWLASVAVIFSVIGAFYYLRVVKIIYFDKPADSAPVNPGLDLHMLFSVNSLAILVLGLTPGSLMALCAAAIAV